MKNFHIAGLIIFLFLISGATKAQSIISGELKEVEKADITINRYNGYSFIVHETVSPATDNKFKFGKDLLEGFYQLNIPSQGIAKLFYVDGKSNLQLTVANVAYEKDKVQFKDDENRALSELLSASKHLEVSLNTLREQFDPRQLDSFYFKKVGPYNLQVQDAYKQFNGEVKKLKANYPNTAVMSLFSSFYQLPLFDEDKVYGKFYDNQDAYMRDHFFDLWKLDDARIIHLPEVKLKLEKYFRFFARKNHGFLIKKCDEVLGRTKNVQVKTYMASLLIDFFTQVKENDVVAHIVENNLNGCLDEIDWGLINFNQNNLRGTKVSELQLPAENLQAVSLASVYNKAKITILYFWTPDCVHCRNLHPVVKKLKEQYGNDIAVYSVGLEDDDKKWKSTIAEFGLNFNNVIAAGEQRKQIKQIFNIKYTPMIFVLNTSGDILDKDLTGEDINASVSKYLK